MSRKRLFIPEIKEQNYEIIHPEQIHYLKNVLRVKKGEEIIVLDGKGWEYKTEVKELSSSKIKVALKKEIFHPPLDYRITLYQSLLKNPKMDFLIQKISELNVDKFVPVITERSIKYDLNEKKIKNKVAHWEKIARFSASQSRRARLMKIESPVLIRKKMNECGNIDKTIVFLEEEQKNLKEVLVNLRDTKNISLFIGPEGGFSKEEIKLLKNQGIISASLGNQVLRSETAAIVVASIIQYEWGIL
ncbi:MAG: RsmE family RNA methyltransferase [bacterium]|nr:RsmE family RNA methyltransferase [bacterium]